MEGLDLNAAYNPQEEEEQEQEGFVNKQQEDAQNSGSRINNWESPPVPILNPDIIFPLDYIAIGTWHREAKSNKGRLKGTIWYRSNILAWEIQEGKELIRIEIPWTHISAIKGTRVEQSLVNQWFVLEVQLNTRPYVFYRPYKAGLPAWRTTSDSAQCEEANRARIHRVRINYISTARTKVESYFEKMLEWDARLRQLNTMPFPSTESPYFDSIPQTLIASSNVDSGQAPHNEPKEARSYNAKSNLIEDQSQAPMSQGLNVGANKIAGSTKDGS